MLEASIIAIIISLIGAIASAGMFFLVAWQGFRRPLNLFMALYLANAFVVGLSTTLARMAPFLGYNPTPFIHLNGTALVAGSYILFTFIVVYRGYWQDERYKWLKYTCIGLLMFCGVIAFLFFSGQLITDTATTSLGSTVYTILPLGYIILAPGYILYIGIIGLLTWRTPQFWKEGVFWGTLIVTLGVFSAFFEELVGFFSIPATAITISILFFANFILHENIFNPLIELNSQLEDTNKRLSQATTSATQSEAYLRNVVENTSDLIWSVNRQHKLVMMNSTASAFFDLLFEKEIAEGASFFQHMAKEDEEQWRTLYTRAFNGRRFSIEQRYYFENLPSHFDLEMSFNPAFNEQNQITSVSVFARDITRYKETERDLKQQALTFENISDSIILIDLEGNISNCNPATAQITGYTKDEILGRKAEFLYLETERDALVKEIDEMMVRRGRWSGEIPFVRKNKLNGIFESVILPLRDGQGKRIANLVVSRDITERKSQEERLRDAKDAAEAANQAKSAFLASMSHELRTPLNAIIGYGEMLQEELSIDQSNQTIQDLNRIIQSGRHLLTIVNSVLDLSKIEAGKVQILIETFSLSELIYDVTNSVQPLINAGGNKLTINLPDKSLPAIHSDETKLRQVLINLIGNAAKFTTNGQITIDVSVGQELGESEFIIKVKDTGIGMSPEAVTTVFDAFVQADTSTTRQYQGTGLGLTICKRFVELLGGTIFASSELDVGSTFTIKLPEAISTIHTTRSIDRSHIILDHDNENDPTLGRNQLNAGGDLILVVDDHSETRDSITRWLYKNGLRVQTATNGKKAVKAAHQQRPNAIILDLSLPDMSSWDVLLELKNDPATSSIKVILSILLNDLKRGFAFVVDSYLMIPAGSLEFAQKLDPLLAKHGANTDILAIDEENGLIDELQGWSTDLNIYHETSIAKAMQTLTTNANCNIIVVDLALFSESAFEVVEAINSLDRAISLVFTSNRNETKDAQNRLSTKSMMSLINAGLHDQSRWLKQLTDHIASK